MNAFTSWANRLIGFTSWLILMLLQWHMARHDKSGHFQPTNNNEQQKSLAFINIKPIIILTVHPSIPSISTQKPPTLP